MNLYETYAPIAATPEPPLVIAEEQYSCENVDLLVKPLPYKYSNKWHWDYGRAIFASLKVKIRGEIYGY